MGLAVGGAPAWMIDFLLGTITLLHKEEVQFGKFASS